MEVTPIPTRVSAPKRWLKYLFGLIIALLLVSSVLAYYIHKNLLPPEEFPVGTPVVIEEGSSISQITKTLHDAHVVKSDLLLYIVVLMNYAPSDIKASTYVFDKPYTTFEVAEKLATGDFTSNLLRLTHREGERVSELAVSVHEILPNISIDDFTTHALPYEGKLFPETYFIPPHFEVEDIVKTLHAKYEEYIETKRELIRSSNLTEDEIIILASIIEREANDSESMKMVSGILQNRLNDNMPLQADASIEYVLEKPLDELTAEDLKIDSPYNTYTNKGLPPTAIGNPGSLAIEAVLEPTPSDYFYYITGKDGTFYYATTYEDHKRNIARYLK